MLSPAGPARGQQISNDAEMRPAPDPLVSGSGAGRVDQVKLRSGKDRQMTVTAVACGPLLPWVTV
jgi:hypothetical protein